jgi:D-alanyl-D-alanine carboxypeptidase
MPVPTATPGTVEPTPSPITGGPPTCAYLDVLTPHRRLSDWDRSLLDTIYRLPSTYAPGDLVDTSTAGLNGGYRIRGFIVEDLRELAANARRAGAPIEVVSGYRSFEQQRATFQHWVNVGGYEQALRTSARAGHSEHQLGTTIDVTSQNGLPPWEYGDWARTPAGAWIARHSWQYGFIVSYPRDSFDRTCYAYEPWHLRYVGRERAREIVESGLTARQYLWTLQ